ncbi:hypothetical protein GCM10011494_05730 [Novosphingobium endophyticum]|uniref:Uncharacterized protein n=1 Tax=Novosphingobium endophyticum TaxID=1955250 RepID=A0A916TPJ8_9SPHN|nr:hypothetical protein [Novosphingobium endophyticum]GGB90244.1 hypothetical protein GCM10011494_05730 [Novosphingobium endophyticum]
MKFGGQMEALDFKNQSDGAGMRGFRSNLAVFALLICGAHSAVYAQSPADGASSEEVPQGNISLDGQQISIAYYRIKPGKQDEWLSLYKNYHLKFLRELTSSSSGTKLYKAQSHRVDGWDFAVVSIYPRSAPRNGMSRERSVSIINKLFGSLESFIDAENRRWELTESHWDEGFVEMALEDFPVTLRIP